MTFAALILKTVFRQRIRTARTAADFSFSTVKDERIARRADVAGSAGVLCNFAPAGSNALSASAPAALDVAAQA